MVGFGKPYDFSASEFELLGLPSFEAIAENSVETYLVPDILRVSMVSCFPVLSNQTRHIAKPMLLEFAVKASLSQTNKM